MKEKCNVPDDKECVELTAPIDFGQEFNGKI